MGLVIFAIAMLVGIVNQCQAQDKTDYVKKYAGEYLIKIEGVSTTDIEKYTLKPDGTCVWEWKSGSMPSRKTGRWSAKQGKIMTVFQGRTGEIPENFNWKEGKFRSEDGYDRYLSKVKAL